jgi:hypothetical protein
MRSGVIVPIPLARDIAASTAVLSIVYGFLRRSRRRDLR